MTSPRKDHPSLPPGLHVFGEYIVDQALEEGPIWKIYRAFHVSKKNETFHLRAMRSAASARRDLIEAFARFARLVEAMSHPGIVPVVANGVDQGGIFIVSPEIAGVTVKQRIEQGGGKLEPAEVARIVRETASVLEYLHNLKTPVVHRTLDPTKIMLAKADSKVKVLDAGYSHAMFEAAVEPADAIPRAPEPYRAPEDQVGTHPTPAIDQYSLAAIAFEALGFRNAAKPTLPAKVETVLTRAQSANAAGRYPSVTVFAEDLARALADTSKTTAPASAASGPKKTTSSPAMPAVKAPAGPTKTISSPAMPAQKPAAPATAAKAPAGPSAAPGKPVSTKTPAPPSVVSAPEAPPPAKPSVQPAPGPMAAAAALSGTALPGKPQSTKTPPPATPAARAAATGEKPGATKPAASGKDAAPNASWAMSPFNADGRVAQAPATPASAAAKSATTRRSTVMGVGTGAAPQVAPVAAAPAVTPAAPGKTAQYGAVTTRAATGALAGGGKTGSSPISPTAKGTAPPPLTSSSMGPEVSAEVLQGVQTGAPDTDLSIDISNAPAEEAEPEFALDEGSNEGGAALDLSDEFGDDQPTTASVAPAPDAPLSIEPEAPSEGDAASTASIDPSEYVPAVPQNVPMAVRPSVEPAEPVSPPPAAAPAPNANFESPFGSDAPLPSSVATQQLDAISDDDLDLPKKKKRSAGGIVFGLLFVGLVGAGGVYAAGLVQIPGVPPFRTLMANYSEPTPTPVVASSAIADAGGERASVTNPATTASDASTAAPPASEAHAAHDGGTSRTAAATAHDAGSRVVATASGAADAGSPATARDAGAPVVVAVVAPPTPTPPAPPTPPIGATGLLPERPPFEAIRAVGEQIQTKINQCEGGSGRHARIHIWYQGATGAVTNLRIAGTYFTSRPIGACIERAVRETPVTPFRRAEWDTSFRFDVR